MTAEEGADALALPAGAVWPDYGEGGLFGLIRSCRRFLRGENWSFAGGDAEPGAEPGEAGKVLVLLLVDGLGDDFLQRFGAGSALLAHRRGRLTSVFPSTTASAVTTVMTGLTPARHGLTGWFIRDERCGGILAPLPLSLRAGSALEAGQVVEELFPYPTLYEKAARASRLVSPREIAWSPFSKRHARGARIAGYGAGLEGLRQELRRAVLELNAMGGGFVYAYYPRFDSISHEFGSRSAEAVEEFRRVDAAFERLLAELQGLSCDVLLTADHGFADASPERTVHLEAYPQLQALLECPLWGERRVAFCAVKPGREAEFEALASEALVGKAVVHPSARLVEAGLFGPGERHPRLAERVGTHALLMEEGWIVMDQLPGEKPYWLTGVHGGLSAQEMHIPLIHARC